MAKLIVANVLSLLLLQFIFQGVKSQYDAILGMDDGCNPDEDDCDDPDELACVSVDGAGVCKTKVGKVCFETPECVPNALCDSDTFQCECDDQAFDVIDGKCEKKAAGSNHDADGDMSGASGAMEDDVDGHADGDDAGGQRNGAAVVAVSLLLFTTACVTSHFF